MTRHRGAPALAMLVALATLAATGAPLALAQEGGGLAAEQSRLAAEHAQLVSQLGGAGEGGQVFIQPTPTTGTPGRQVFIDPDTGAVSRSAFDFGTSTTFNRVVDLDEDDVFAALALGGVWGWPYFGYGFYPGYYGLGLSPYYASLYRPYYASYVYPSYYPTYSYYAYGFPYAYGYPATYAYYGYTLPSAYTYYYASGTYAYPFTYGYGWPYATLYW